MTNRVSIVAGVALVGVFTATAVQSYLHHKDIEGCLADKDDKAYLVYKDGTIERKPMHVSDKGCIELGDIETAYGYDRLNVADILAEGKKYDLPKGFSFQPSN